VTDWQAWHNQYDDADSNLSRRLGVVRQRLAELVAAEPGLRRILSLCSGDGRDVLPVLADQPAERRPEVVLVELDPVLAAAAGQRARDLGVAATVVVGDAGLVSTWRSFAPVDLLMLCGIFGNISDQDIRATVEATPTIVTPGGAVIWTRGASADEDLRPAIRGWFGEAGLVESAFEGVPDGYGVGVHRLAGDGQAAPLPERLFTFVR
jgi:hypothetical protein